MERIETRFGEIDVSELTGADVANLALQRTATLFHTGIKRLGAPSYVFWARFDKDWPLRLEARLRRRKIVTGALATIGADVEQISACLGAGPVARLCDIGCGYAFHDLLLSRVLNLTDILLIDIEHTPERHHDFNRRGAGYSNLERARELIMRNSPPGQQPHVSCLNPQRQAMDFSQSFDLVISLLSCGFHYPVDTYLEFFERCLAPGGRIVLDLRRSENHDSLFDGFRIEREINGDEKSARVVLVRK